MLQIDHDVRRIVFDVQRLFKITDGAKEQIAVQHVALAAIRIGGRTHLNANGFFPGKRQRRNHDAHQHGQCQVVPDDGDGRHDHHHQHILQRHFVQNLEALPVEGEERHHHHHPGQRRHRNALDHRCAHQHDQDDGQRRHHPRDPAAGARVDVYQRLRNHRAAAHAREKAVEHIGCALRHRLARAVALGFGDFIHQVECEQSFGQAHGRHHGRVRQDQLEGFPGKRHNGNMERRQRAADRRNIAHRFGVDAKNQHDGKHHDDGRQRRGKLLGDFGKQKGDGHRNRHQRSHREHGAALQQHFLPAGIRGEKLLNLRAENNHGQAIDKAVHHALGHQANVFGPFANANDDLNHPCQRHGGKGIFQPMRLDERNQRHHRGPCAARNQARAATKQGRHQPRDKGRVQARQRRKARQNSE